MNQSFPSQNPDAGLLILLLAGASTPGAPANEKAKSAAAFERLYFAGR